MAQRIKYNKCKVKQYGMNVLKYKNLHRVLHISKFEFVTLIFITDKLCKALRAYKIDMHFESPSRLKHKELMGKEGHCKIENYYV